MARSKSASPWDASDQSTTPVTSSPSTKTWSTCRSPWMNTGVHGRSAVSASWRLRVTRSAGRTPLATSHSHSPSRRDASSSRLRPGHGGSGASCNVRTTTPAAAHAAGDAVDGSPRRPSAVPGRAASASTGGLRHRISGVWTGAIAIASTSTSVRVWSASTFRNTSPTRKVARSLWATTSSTSTIVTQPRQKEWTIVAAWRPQSSIPFLRLVHQGAEHRQVATGLAGGSRVVGLADVAEVQRVQPVVARAQLMADEVAPDVPVAEVGVAADRGLDDAVHQVDALVDLGARGLAQPDAVPDAELVEDRVVQHHHLGVRGVAADVVVGGVEQAGQAALRLGLGGVYRGHAVAGAADHAGGHDAGEADVVAADGDADQAGGCGQRRQLRAVHGGRGG